MKLPNNYKDNTAYGVSHNTQETCWIRKGHNRV